MIFRPHRARKSDARWYRNIRTASTPAPSRLSTRANLRRRDALRAVLLPTVGSTRLTANSSIALTARNQQRQCSAALDCSSDQLSNGSTAAASRPGADRNAFNHSCGVAAGDAGLGTGPDAKPAWGRTPAGAPWFRSAYARLRMCSTSFGRPTADTRQTRPANALFRCCQIAHHRTLMAPLYVKPWRRSVTYELTAGAVPRRRQ
jgi:hypothetical protein